MLCWISSTQLCYCTLGNIPLIAECLQEVQAVFVLIWGSATLGGAAAERGVGGWVGIALPFEYFCEVALFTWPCTLVTELCLHAKI